MDQIAHNGMIRQVVRALEDDQLVANRSHGQLDTNVPKHRGGPGARGHDHDGRGDRPLGGLDALLSMAQMPSGVPVATVGIDNSSNAAHLALRILGRAAPAA